MSEPPIKLDYQTPPPRSPENRNRFFKGLGFGAVASVILWGIAVAAHSGEALLVLLIAIPATKLFVGGALTTSPQRRYFGLGLLVSIPLGGLIAFGICATGMR